MFDEKLARALNFSKEDLAANRDGNMTKEQGERLRREIMWRRVIIPLALGLILTVGLSQLAVSAPFIPPASNNFSPLTIVLVVVVLYMIFCVFGPYYNWQALNVDLRKEEIYIVEGRIKLDADNGSQLRIYKRTFNIPKAALLALHNDEVYRIYLTSHMKRLLSLERVAEG